MNRHRSRSIEHLFKTQRTEMHKNEHHSQNESRIADSIYDKCLFPGIACALLVEIKSDQQVGAQPHSFPPDKHHHVVVGQDQGEHRKHEEVQIGEEAIIAAVVPHVSGRIDVNQETDSGNDQDHDGRKRIQLKSPGHFKSGHASVRQGKGSTAKPGKEVEGEQLFVFNGKELIHTQRAHNKGERHRSKSDDGNELLVQLPAGASQRYQSCQADERTPG